MACSSSSSESEPELEPIGEGTEDFITSWDPTTCLIAKARKPELRICLRGNANVTVAKQKTTQALNAWLNPLRARYEGVATSIVFDCTSADGTVNAYAGNGGGMAGPSVVHQVYEQGAIGTWIHEFGHAFACLGDTYVGGRAGACMAGQARSAMCHGLLISDVTEDDIAGLVQQAKRLGYDRAPVDPAGDGDGDGIANAQDRCPGTTVGARIWHEEHEGRWRGCAQGQRVTN